MQPSRLIYYPLAVVFITGLVLLLQAYREVPKQSLHIRVIGGDHGEGKALAGDTLLQNTSADLFVTSARGKAMYWQIATPTYDTLHYIEGTQPFNFTTPGEYHITAYDRLRKAGEGKLYINEGHFVRMNLASATVTEGAEIRAVDKSTAKAEQTLWRLTSLRESNFIEILENAKDFVLTAPKPGTYTLHLEYLNEAGEKIMDQSEEITIIPKPQPQRTSTQVAEKKEPTEEELRRAAERRAALDAQRASEDQKRKDKKADDDRLRREKEAEEARKKREAAERADADKSKTARNTMTCWYDHKSGTQFNAGPATPAKREDVEFKSGTAVFTITPKEDIALVGLSFWGNYAVGNVSMTIECITCEKAGEVKKLRPVEFMSGNNFYNPIYRSVATGKGFVKGQTYKIMVTTEPEKQLGFATLKQKKWDDSFMEIAFESNQTPVYGLTFQRR